MIAYRRNKKGQVYVTAEDAVYHESSWYMAHTLGVGPNIHHKPAHVTVRNDWTDDARIMSPEASAEYQSLTDAVTRAMKIRDAWVAEHFREWPIVNAENAARVLPGHTKAEATRSLKAAKKPSAEQVLIERKMLTGINRAFTS